MVEGQSGALQEHDPHHRAHHDQSRQGRGAALGIIRLRPAAGSEDRLREALRQKLDPAQIDGVISMHLIESDPRSPNR